VTISDLLWFFPLAAAVGLVVGASGRSDPRAIARGAVRTFVTLAAVVAGVGLTIRLLVILFV
jgi:hypothetical protein